MAIASNHTTTHIPCTHIPFNSEDNVLGGEVYIGRMPKLEELQVLGGYRKILNVSHVILLQESRDWEKKLKGKDLRELYKMKGYKVSHYPIIDTFVPEDEKMEEIISKIIEVISKGNNVFIHCTKGTGRTAMVAAILAGKVLKLPPKPAMEFVERFIPIPQWKYRRNQYKFIMRYLDPESYDKKNKKKWFIRRIWGVLKSKAFQEA